MATRRPAELATQLVQAFGRPDDMIALLTDDVTWWISPSVPAEVLPNFSVGKEIVHETIKTSLRPRVSPRNHCLRYSQRHL